MLKKYLNRRITAVDVETTSLSPLDGGRVIEIGAIVVEKGEIAGEFHSLINIDAPVPKEVTKIHGITTEMLTGQPKTLEILPRFLEYIKDSILIAHNAQFDISFLKAEFARIGMPLDNDHLCTLQMSRKYFPDLLNHRLETVARYLIKDLPDDIRLHRAIDDARLVARIWMEMLKRGEFY